MTSLVPQNAVQPQSIEFNDTLNVHLPTVLGLQFKNNMPCKTSQTSQSAGAQVALQQQQQQHQEMQLQQQQQQPTMPSSSPNPNSLLKQQLRAGLKDLIDVTLANANPTTTTTTTSLCQQQTAPNTPIPTVSSSHHMDTQEACSALQSLATAAERQAAQNSIQPPSANNLHHQFLLHMAANPIMKSSGEFFQQHQNALLLREDENNLDLLMDQQSDKSDPEMLTLADENAGLDYSTGNETSGPLCGNNENLDSSTNHNTSSSNPSGHNSSGTPRKSVSGKPVQRRRIRRKAQSSIDDQAEQLTEMSVRGLDLFRYASINEGVYQCTECAKENMQKTFKNKYSFQRHAFLYHEGKHRKVFPCPLCGKEFSRPDKMKNHMKMTHESFAAKDIQNFNPLNYLISAAAAGEIQASFPPQCTTSTGGSTTTVTSTTQPLISQLQSSNPALSIMINNNGDNAAEEGLNLSQQQECSKENHPHQLQLQDQQQLKFPTDIEIKNEIVISPSPSPPPLIRHQLPTGTSVSLAESSLALMKSVNQNTTATNAQLNAQRLEEVK